MSGYMLGGTSTINFRSRSVVYRMADRRPLR